MFYPIAVKRQGPLNESARDLVRDVGRRIALCSGDDCESSFLFQRVSVVVQRFNSVLLHDSCCVDYKLVIPDQFSSLIFITPKTLSRDFKNGKMLIIVIIFLFLLLLLYGGYIW